MNCERLAEHDHMISTKDEEITRLKSRVRELERRSPLHVAHSPTPDPSASPRDAPSFTSLPAGTVRSESTSRAKPASVDPAMLDGPVPVTSAPTVVHPGTPERHLSGPGEKTGTTAEGSRPRRGKAPPIDAFTGESPDVLFEDWLPALQCAAEWNGWSNSETLIQLAGYLRGRALQEWGLLSSQDKSTLDRAISALRNQLDPCSRALAAQDFTPPREIENQWPILSGDWSKCSSWPMEETG